MKNYMYQSKWLLLLLSVLVCAFVYWPALSGPFLFDDFPNLAPLSSYNAGIISAAEVIWGGSSSTLGRPIAMASFLLGSEFFPHNPWIFKFINLLVHLMNGVLVYFFTQRLAVFTSLSKERSFGLAIFCSSCWLLHPFLMSSVLLVVQRMTLLMTFFALASMLAYLKSREGTTNKARITFLVLYVFFACLSVLSKENGVLIPFYLLVIEGSLLKNKRVENQASGVKSWFFLKAPVLLVIGYMVYKTPEFVRGFARRDFSLTERLLTETRVVLDYFINIAIPKLGNTGLFHDSYEVSHSLFQPLSTFVALMVISLLLGSAIYLRSRMPVYSMAILFFFIGHLIESTIVPLELYFEHRNYLPSIGLIFGGTYFVLSKIPSVKVLAALALLYLVLAGGISHLNAKVWGSLRSVASVWAVENPESVRSQALLSRYFKEIERYDLAGAALNNAIEIKPDDISLQFELIVNECQWKQKVEKSLVNTSSAVIANGQYNHGIPDSLAILVGMLAGQICAGLNSENILILIDAALSNNSVKNVTTLQALHFQKGEIQLYQGLYDEAMHSYNEFQKLKPNADVYEMQIRVSINLGKREEARRYLALLIHTDEKNPLYKKSYQPVIAEFSAILQGVSLGTQ